jgi:hypothetical protein
MSEVAKGETLFEVYLDDAYQALQNGDDVDHPSRAELIGGLESMDLEGRGGAPVAHAVLEEAVIIADALRRADVARDSVSLADDFPRLYKQRFLEAGWHVANLETVPVYSEGRVRQEAGTRVMLTTHGSLYVYRPVSEPNPNILGTVFNRYAPACSTRINDRSILHGFAVLVAKHEIDPFPQPDCI